MRLDVIGVGACTDFINHHKLHAYETLPLYILTTYRTLQPPPYILYLFAGLLLQDALLSSSALWVPAAAAAY